MKESEIVYYTGCENITKQLKICGASFSKLFTRNYILFNNLKPKKVIKSTFTIFNQNLHMPSVSVIFGIPTYKDTIFEK